MIGLGCMPANRVVLIAGPTASGKSALALELAERLGGVIINADSMQVYHDLPILSARPSQTEMTRAPHLLFGHVDAGVNYSVGRWLADVQGALAAADSAGLVPILTGGTGLYFKALIEGLSDMPAVPEIVRSQVRAEAHNRSTADIHAQLAAVDPAAAARVRISDRLRTLRALEVHTATGRSITSFYDERATPVLAGRLGPRLFLNRPREELQLRIEKRFGEMIVSGALDEIAALAGRQLDPALPAMRAHGVPWLLRHIAGEIALDAACEGAVADTRRYAKRQVTWFRGQMPGWDWVEPETALDFTADMQKV